MIEKRYGIHNHKLNNMVINLRRKGFSSQTMEELLMNQVEYVAEKTYEQVNPYYKHIIKVFPKLIKNLEKSLLIPTESKDQTHLFGLLYNLCTSTLSLSKNVILGIGNSVGSVFLIRTILENSVILKLFIDQKIDDKYILLFKHHYRQFDYQFEKEFFQQMYHDSISPDTEHLRNLALKLFSESFPSLKSPEYIFTGRYGWACQVIEGKDSVSFKNILDKFGDEFEISTYDLMSILMHPHIIKDEVELSDALIRRVLFQAQSLIIRAGLKLGLQYSLNEQNMFIPDIQKFASASHFNNLIFEDLTDDQNKILNEIISLIQPLDTTAYYSRTLELYESFLMDTIVDFILGFQENCRAKFKWILEELCFQFYLNETKLDPKRIYYINEHFHLSYLKTIKDPIYESETQIVYQRYLTDFQSNLSYEKFIQQFVYKTFGYTIDETGKTLSINQMMKTYIPQIVGERQDLPKELFYALYEEVNSISHASMFQCFSFYANQAKSIIHSLKLIDISINYILTFYEHHFNIPELTTLRHSFAKLSIDKAIALDRTIPAKKKK